MVGVRRRRGRGLEDGTSSPLVFGPALGSAWCYERKAVRDELVVGAALTYIGATIRSGAMAYPYLLTLKLTRKVLTSSGHLLNSIGLF